MYCLTPCRWLCSVMATPQLPMSNLLACVWRFSMAIESVMPIPTRLISGLVPPYN